MENCKIKNLYNLDETIAKELLEKFEKDDDIQLDDKMILG